MKTKSNMLIAITIYVILSICTFSHNSSASDEIQEKVYHVVICWLKEPNNESHKQKLIDETTKLASIPGIILIKVGDMIVSERPIVDSTYDVGIIMTFNNEEDMNNYLANPLHKKATKEVLVPLTSKVIVYDFKI